MPEVVLEEAGTDTWCGSTLKFSKGGTLSSLDH